MSSAPSLKSPPLRAPRRLHTNADLRALQRLMTHALAQPLTADDQLAPKLAALGGRDTAAVAAEFIKPNGRLTSFERLEIYARSYWFRLIDCVYDDSPGLRAVLGEERFSALVRAYLAQYPSRSFTLRNLCARLPQFIREKPRLTAPHTALAHEVACFEWAQTVAFDGEAIPVLTPADFARTPPARLRVALQPYLTLLDLHWPIDDFVIAVKERDALRADASNTPDAARRTTNRWRKRVALPRRERVCVVVHRFNLRLFYKRVEPAAFRILMALSAGRTLTQAIAAGGTRVTPQHVREWFVTWTELGWLCQRQNRALVACK